MRHNYVVTDNNNEQLIAVPKDEYLLPKSTLEILATAIYSDTNSTKKVNLANNSDSDYYTMSDDLASYVRNKNYVRDTRDAYNLFHPIPHNLHDVVLVAGLDQHESYIFTKREYRWAFLSCCEKAYYIDNNGNYDNVFTQAQIDDLENWFETLPDNHILINGSTSYATKYLESKEDELLKMERVLKDLRSSALFAFVSSAVITSILGYNVELMILELCGTAAVSFITTIAFSVETLRVAFPNRHISPFDLNLAAEEQQATIALNNELLLNLPENVQGMMGTEFYDLSTNASYNNNIESDDLSSTHSADYDDIKSDDLSSTHGADYDYIESDDLSSTNGVDQDKIKNEIANENVLKNTHSPNTTLHNDSPLSETKLNFNPNTQDRSISD
jgi:hypothetical protein